VDKLTLGDLKVITTVGVGGFSRVSLVRPHCYVSHCNLLGLFLTSYLILASILAQVLPRGLHACCNVFDIDYRLEPCLGCHGESDYK